jgi:hypothetical protein
MTDQHHPITPPPELVLQWLEDGPEDGEFGISKHIATHAARWGADQELEACCEWLSFYSAASDARDLRIARRPPPSLKEQAKFAAAVLRSPDETCSIAELQQHWHTICNALESLPD